MAEEGMDALFIPTVDSDPETEVCEYSMSNHFNTSEGDDDDDVSFPWTPGCDGNDDNLVAAAVPL